MTAIRGVIKISIFGLLILSFLTLTSAVRIFFRDQAKRRSYYTRIVSITCKFGVWFLNTDVLVTRPPEQNKNYLFVGNHLGILDIIVLASIRPCLFITSVEMQQTPLLGLLCEMGGCLFVERRSRSNIHNEIGVIRNALKEGNNITLYPEGTSTNGERVLPFKKSLLTAAAGSGAPILPLVINYTHVNGEPISTKNRDFVCWYGDQTFPPILWRLVTNTSVRAEVEFFEEIHVQSEEERREVAAKAHDLIASRFRPIVNA